MAVNRLQHRFNPSIKVLLCFRYRLIITSRRRFARYSIKISPDPLPRNVMRQRGKPQLWFTPSSRCYSFESCFHGWRIFSLHRRPDLPLYGAHVAREQFNCCWPLPHGAGSPDLRVLPASLTSARPSDRPRFVGLSGPTSLRLNLTDLPCSPEALRLHAGGKNPGSTPEHLPYRMLGFRLPH